MTRKFPTREAWLEAAVQKLRPLFKQHSYDVPKNVRVSVGFPTSKKAAAQCFNPKCSADETHEIFCSPRIAEPSVILHTLVHELVHAVVGTEAQHKKPFKDCATTLGLEGKITATHPGLELAGKLLQISEKLGPFPHAVLTPKQKDKQTTRLIKVVCPECDYVARVTRVHLDEKGSPICPVDKVSFVEEIKE